MDGTRELIATIGAMQTFVSVAKELFKPLKNKTYTSAIEFILDILHLLGVNERELLDELIEILIGKGFNVNSFVDAQGEKLDGITDSAFLQKLEGELKNILGTILAEVLSCTIHPYVPDDFVENGIRIPISFLDPQNMLATCPSSRYGKYLYGDIPSDATPAALSGCTDLNAVIWYSIFKDDATWCGDTKSVEMFTLENQSYENLKIKLKDQYRGSTLSNFNKDYLSTIHLLYPRSIIVSLIDELLNGVTNLDVNLNLVTLITDGQVDNIIKNVIEQDDAEINDCYFTFSNRDWDEMIKNMELRRYNAIQYNDDSVPALSVDTISILDSLDAVSSAATRYDQITQLKKTFTDVLVPARIDPSISTRLDFSANIDPHFLDNLIKALLRPIIKSLFSPKVMALLMINYEAAGLIDLQEIVNNPQGALKKLLQMIMAKMLGFVVRFALKVKDMLVAKLLDILYDHLMPLLLSYSIRRTLEQVTYYLALLDQARKCIAGINFDFGRGQYASLLNGKRELDNVTYADIVPQAVVQEQSIC